jgi:hypothetical protein
VEFEGSLLCSQEPAIVLSQGNPVHIPAPSFFMIQLSITFLLLHVIQTGSGVQPTSYKMGTGGSFPGVKRQGREADHSPPTSAEVKKMWIYISTPPYVFIV